MGSVEQSVVEALKFGEAYQADLVRATGFSKSRVSEVLTKLERDGVIGRTHVGKNYVVYLKSPPPERRQGKVTLGIIRSAEYPYVVPLKKRLYEKGIDLEIKVYDNGIDVMKELSMGKLDFGISPMVMQLFFYFLESPIKIIAPAGAGGASIVSGKYLSEHPRVASTKLSTMELLVRTTVSGAVMGEVGDMSYARSPESLVKMLEEGRAEAIGIWEPYVTMLTEMGFHKLTDYSDFGEHYCCTLASHSSLPEKTVSAVVSAFRDALSAYRSNPDTYLAPYSALIGMPYKLVLKAASAYTYPDDLSASVMLRQIEQAGIRVPYPGEIRDAIWRPRRSLASKTNLSKSIPISSGRTVSLDLGLPMVARYTPYGSRSSFPSTPYDENIMKSSAKLSSRATKPSTTGYALQSSSPESLCKEVMPAITGLWMRFSFTDFSTHAISSLRFAGAAKSLEQRPSVGLCMGMLTSVAPVERIRGDA